MGKCQSLDVGIDTEKRPGIIMQYSICEFLPMGFSHLGIEQLQLTNETKQRIETLKTSKEVLQFKDDFGSHFSSGTYNYGGMNIQYTAKPMNSSKKEYV